MENGQFLLMEYTYLEASGFYDQYIDSSIISLAPSVYPLFSSVEMSDLTDTFLKNISFLFFIQISASRLFESNLTTIWLINIQ
mgnify:CR=1 FL=1